MRVKLSDLKTERQWRSATGNDEKRFKKRLCCMKDWDRV
jgi:hypothetical protein